MSLKKSAEVIVIGTALLWCVAAWAQETKLPRLVDLGADRCIPCKMMAPVLADLKTNYVGQLDVEFIDVWKKPAAAERYKIQVIPTQIFYDTTGKERFRHQGFLSKQEILTKWKELGVDLKSEDRNPKIKESPKSEERGPRVENR